MHDIKYIFFEAFYKHFSFLKTPCENRDVLYQNDLPLAISMKVVFSSAGYLCFIRGGSLMNLVRSAVHLSGPRGPATGRERGRNQNGIAESRVMTPAMR